MVADGPMGTTRRVFGDAQPDDGSVLVAGGRNDAGEFLDSSERYDPTSGSWASPGTMAGARVGPRLTTLADGQVLATGGGAPQPLNSAELYTP
jgi:Galactose oxidase, central domain